MGVAAVINSWLRSSESSPSRVASSQSGRSAGRVAPEVKRNWLIRRWGMATRRDDEGDQGGRALTWLVDKVLSGTRNPPAADPIW